MSSHLLRSDFDPMVGGYVIIMAALAAGLWLSRRPGAPRRAARPGPEFAPVTAASWRRLARRVAGTMLGGYLLLMVVVVLYYYLVARVGGAFIKSAFTGCALLIGLVTPVFAAASWLTEQLRARSARRPHPPSPDPPVPVTRRRPRHPTICRPTATCHPRCAPFCPVCRRPAAPQGDKSARTMINVAGAEGGQSRKAVTAASNSAGNSRCGEWPQPGRTRSV
jgi:Family of unknown function (DUF6256)